MAVSKRFKLDTIKWYPILSNDLLTTKLVFKTYYIGDIVDIKQANFINQRLSELYPLKNIQYKRIKKTLINGKDVSQVIITDSSVDETLNIPSDLEKYIKNMSQASLPTLDVKTRKQYNLVSTYWPLKFHENKEIELLVNNKFNSSNENKELHMHDKYARLIYRLFKKINKSIALIADPKLNKIVSIGIDRRTIHPLKHSTIDSIDNTQLKQLLSDQDNEKNSSKKEILELLDNEDGLDFKIVDDNNYLFTNYYAYLTHEPCSMCAMALLHSRILKIFYLYDTSDGYLYSKCKLHTIENINHRFQVFKAGNIDGHDDEIDYKKYFHTD